MQERWYNYICEEFVPRLLEINREQGKDHTGRILTGGASMGGGHAVNFYLRRPDIFNGTIALSGLYSSGMFFGNYMDDLVYRNSPCDYMRNFPADHPYKELYAKADKFIKFLGEFCHLVCTIERARIGNVIVCTIAQYRIFNL